MTDFKIQVTTKIPSASSGDVFVIGAKVVANSIELLHSPIAIGNLADQNLEALGITGQADELKIYPGPQGSAIAVAGMDLDGESKDKFRYLGGVIGRNCFGFKRVIIALPDLNQDDALALVEGFSLGYYAYSAYKSAPKKSLSVANLILITKVKLPPASLRNIDYVVKAVHDSRNLVNQPANDLYPASFEKHAKARVRSLPISIRVWDESALLKAGFGGISAVGAGSSRPPRLIKISYSPRGAKKHLALVGKGITFDTGGLSLKPAESMVGMKYDMTGAATVLQSVIAASQLGVKTKVTGWICLAENMPSGTA
ncbi:MAG: leucyl aminopeptidase family protein, partial [Micrococcales bacterium]